MRILIAATLAILTTAASADIYKCTIDGVVTYQASPCGLDAREIEVEPAPPVDPNDVAAATGYVRIGMTKSQVIRSWGRPDRINTSLYSSGKREQWVYRRHGESDQYVYFKSGFVTSVN